MSDIRYLSATSSVTRVSADQAYLGVQGTRDGAIFTADWFMARALEGRMFSANSGVDTTPATHAGVYDANGPDYHIHVPAGTLIVPCYIGVKYEAIGTESEMEVIALASSTGDSSVTGTGLTIMNMRMDAPVASLCTATGAVAAAGVTDPNAGNFIEFWRAGHPLADTPATGENDRAEHVYEWKSGEMGFAPVIPGAGSLSVYATGQAATGFITVVWVEVPSTSIV